MVKRMILEYIKATRSFIIQVPRAQSDLVQRLMTEHGLDFSQPASTPEMAVLYTQEPYAACAFGQYATPRAREALGGLLEIIETSRAQTSNISIALPPDKELWDFQKANLAYILPREHSLVADEPGLGKTPTAIAFANEIKANDVLVLCPANIRFQWARKISEWSTMTWPYYCHVITNGKRGVHPTQTGKPGWNIVSYDLARTPAIGAALAQGRYDLLILDEAHYLKTSDSKRTQALFGGSKTLTFGAISQRSSRILALTGTPLPNRPREAYTLARNLCWDSIDWLSEEKFRERFNPSLLRENQKPTGEVVRFVDERTGRAPELQARLRGNFMARHLKREVMTQLKLPVYDIIQLEDTGPVKQALLAESLLGIDPESLEGADAMILGHVSEVRKMMGIALAPQVADYVEMLLGGGEEKLVLFGHHREVLNILQERLGKYGLVRIDGSTSPRQREANVKAFQEDPGIRIILGNLLAMGVGTDGLQHVCNHVLIAEPDWTPGNNIQAIDRLDRGGQKLVVQADIFVAPNSFAERILAAALRKLQTTHAALDRRL